MTSRKLHEEICAQQFDARRHRREQSMRGLVPYKSLWLPSEQVELVQETALRHLVYGPGTFGDCEDRVRQTMRNDTQQYNFAILDNEPHNAFAAAIQMQGRRRALEYARRQDLRHKRSTHPRREF